MKNILRTLLIIFGLFFITQGIYADKLITEKNLKTKKLKAGAAGCSAGAGFAFLDINNIKARINTGGDMWWDFDRAQYFVPANTQKTSMFSASLWIGGLDVNGQLKLAGQRYRGNGDDYWPGPLSIEGSASVDEETCSEYDKFYKLTREEVDEYLGWWNSTNRSEEFPGYSIPLSIIDWPAHGDVSKDQSYYLAPFYDENGDGDYDPNQGEYPYYDIDNSLCTTLTPTMDAEYYYPNDPENWRYGILSDQVIKGDQTLWWVFNDKGNVHTETTGAPIGMEIRGQAFGFSTNDEVNNMTFYSYEIINRSTFTLTETYFSQWVDTDLGYAYDDYVGCDVNRGLGYCYNGVPVDGTGQPEAYGVQPPAIGVDFFQGPYMDPDGIDNPKYTYEIGPNGDTISKIQICDVSINGINFEDGIVDNERYGMRRFVYHDNCGGGPTCDPSIAPEYYNFLRGIWKDNTKMQYGGNAHFPDADGPETDFMFPHNTDPCNWSTGGIPPNAGWNQNGKFWSEETANNNPYDRRFMQSAGPFDLLPGAVNYITVGIPWARATSGGPWASVQLLRVVDDKAQALFDNCFKVLDGPSAPDLTFLEMDRKLIVYVSNKRGSNNYQESYKEIDPNIQIADSIPQPIRDSLRTYTFEGYQIYQFRTSETSVESIDDPDVSRLVAQFDIKNGITKLVNYYYDQSIGGNVPEVEVTGGDQGISHSFEITQDAFTSTGDPYVVNHKQYYYLVVAYAFNEYQPYSQEPGVVNGLYGQKRPYLAGRKNIKVYTAIPHKIVSGVSLNSVYGDRFEITRIQGQGNGGFDMEMKQESIDEILLKPPASADNPYGGDDYPIAYNPTYEVDKGPLNVKVVDPLNVKSGTFTFKFTDVNSPAADTIKINNAKWVIIDEAGNEYPSDTTISIRNEQIIPELGISVNVEKIGYPGDSISINNGFLRSEIKFTDSSQVWYGGIPDIDVPGLPLNWIRSGVYKDDQSQKFNDWDMSGNGAWDPLQYYEKMIYGTWAPYCMVAASDEINIGPAYNKISKSTSVLGGLASVDVVITDDRSHWTRCPVVEMSPDPLQSEGGALQYNIRKSPSIDKDGNFAEDGAIASDNPEDATYINATGMGWFPGYAINLETGERLNLMYSENSWLAGDNGRDMQWNPSTRPFDDQFNMIFGGMHYLYVMKHIDLKYGINVYQFPAYDAGKMIRDTLTGTLPAILNLTALYSSTMYVNIPLAVSDSVWLPEGNDVTIKIRVAKPYERYFSAALDSLSDKNQNNFNPMYTFTTAGFEPMAYSDTKNESDLDLINIVPNPYYAYADGPGYERNQLDNRVKITNLPERCVVTIYSISGTLIRQYDVDKAGVSNPRGSVKGVETETITSIDWDLKNFAGIPIAGGLYLIHVKETGGRSGERVIKWFGAMRPIDLNTF